MEGLKGDSKLSEEEKERVFQEHFANIRRYTGYRVGCPEALEPFDTLFDVRPETWDRMKAKVMSFVDSDPSKRALVVALWVAVSTRKSEVLLQLTKARDIKDEDGFISTRKCLDLFTVMDEDDMDTLQGLFEQLCALMENPIDDWLKKAKDILKHREEGKALSVIRAEIASLSGAGLQYGEKKSRKRPEADVNPVDDNI